MITSNKTLFKCTSLGAEAVEQSVIAFVPQAEGWVFESQPGQS